jgi:cytochrome c2
MRAPTARSALVAGLAVVAIAAAPSASQPQKPASQTAEHMRVHFGKAIEAHDAVVRGDLEAVRAPAEWLASHEATPELDKASASLVASMRHAAQQAVDAKDIESAATAAASMLAACGTCHRAARAVPPGVVPDHPTVGGTVGHMLEHKRALDMMMQGLIIPSGDLYRKGAEALKTSPLKTSALPRDPRLTRDILAAEDAIHLLAERAAAASDQQTRVTTYGQIIANCARCHALHGRVWGPGPK